MPVLEPAPFWKACGLVTFIELESVPLGVGGEYPDGLAAGVLPAGVGCEGADADPGVGAGVYWPELRVLVMVEVILVVEP